jgi:lysophospholipase L1-like esterase
MRKPNPLTDILARKANSQLAKTPVTSYATLADLYTAYPNGASGVYFVVEDGGSYSWDADMRLWINEIGLTDIFKGVTIVDGYYLNASHTLESLAAFNVTDYIDVSKISMIIVKDKAWVPYILYFDANHNYLSQTDGTGTTVDLYSTVPSTAKYARINVADDALSTFYIRALISEKNILPSTTLTNDTYINTNGVTETLLGLSVTEPIDVTNIKSFKIKNANITPLLVYTDKDNNHLSHVNGSTTSGEIIQTPPQNAVFVRINLGTNELSTDYIKVTYKNTDWVSVYKQIYTQGLYMVNIGDSLTAYNKWQHIVVNRLKLSGYEVFATVGGYLTTGMYQNLNNINPTAGIVTIWGGTNDWSYSVTLGSFADTVAGGTSYCATLRYMVEYISQNFPKARLFLITPAQRYCNDPAGSPNTSYTLTTDGLYKNSSGDTLEDFVNIMISVGKYYSIPVIDLYHGGFINSKNYTTYYIDGIHENDAGGKLHAGIIASTMEKYL